MRPCTQDVALSSQHLRSAVSICLMHIRGEALGAAPAAKAAGGPSAHNAAKQAAQGAGASAAARLPAAIACGFRQVPHSRGCLAGSRFATHAAGFPSSASPSSHTQQLWLALGVLGSTVRTAP